MTWQRHGSRARTSWAFRSGVPVSSAGHAVGTSRIIRKASSSNFACPLMLLVASTAWPLFGLSDPNERSVEARDSGAKTSTEVRERGAERSIVMVIIVRVAQTSCFLAAGNLDDDNPRSTHERCVRARARPRCKFNER